MTFARVVWWKTKSGMRDEVITRMDEMSGELKKVDGYRGLISFVSMSNPDRLTMISFWESEDAMKASQEGILQRALSSVSDLIDGPPQIANQKVHNFDMAKILA